MLPKALFSFDRNFLTGILLPAILLVGGQLLIEYGVVATTPLLDVLRASSEHSVDEAVPTILVLGVVAVGGFISAMSISVIRLYEGYPWRRLPIVRRLETRANRNLIERQTEIKKLRKAHPEKKGAEQTELGKRIIELQNDLVGRYPEDPDWVLPTRLGNAMRAFESYSYRRYGIEAITFWPRLFPLLPEALGVDLAGKAASFQFLIHTTGILQLIAVECFILSDLQMRPLLSGLLLFVASYGTYLGSVEAAKSWGHSVAAAFDLHRRDLLRALGISPPVGIEAERELWEELRFFLDWGAGNALSYDRDLVVGRPPKSL